jgi:hypothetical protein
LEPKGASTPRGGSRGRRARGGRGDDEDEDDDDDEGEGEEEEDEDDDFAFVVPARASVSHRGGGGAPQPWAVGALPLKDDLVTEWEKPDVRSAVKADAEALARAHSGSLFMVSGGPVGKVIIAWMWAVNPTNKYVDFGSTLDPFLRGKHTRAYHNPNHQHAAQVDPSWYIAADGNPVSLR